MLITNPVTPFAGVWIEIGYDRRHKFRSLCHSLRGSVDWNPVKFNVSKISVVSLPSRECGLKFTVLTVLPPVVLVTPFAGVWIEITSSAGIWCGTDVTPFAGVWIEICWRSNNLRTQPCHSLRGSVDWNCVKPVIHIPYFLSLPSRECGLKFNHKSTICLHMLSLPSRECGLKSRCILPCLRPLWSLPSRECGLKLKIFVVFSVMWRHSLRGSVDWNPIKLLPMLPTKSHSLRGSVDWNN